MKQRILKLIGHIRIVHNPLADLMIIILCLIRQRIGKCNDTVKHLRDQHPEQHGNDQQTCDHRQDQADHLGKLLITFHMPLLVLRNLSSKQAVKYIAVKYHQRIQQVCDHQTICTILERQ